MANVNDHLKNIQSSINILDLPEGSDGDSSLPIEADTLKGALFFYFSLIRNDSGCENVCLPEINPCRDRTIDLHFKCNDAALLINFKAGGKAMSFYGYGFKSMNGHNYEDQIKDTFNFIDTEQLHGWIRKYLIEK